MRDGKEKYELCLRYPMVEIAYLVVKERGLSYKWRSKL